MRCKTAVALAVALLCVATASVAFEAGAARVTITPPQDADFGHVSLGGFGARMGAAYEGVHDDIYARALVLRQGDTTVALVALDRLEVPRFLHEDVAARVEDLGIATEGLIITASHTHSAPENMARGGDIFPLAFGRYNKALYDWTVGQIVQAMRQAVASLRPALLGSAQTRLDGMNRNRRGDKTVDADLTVVKVAEPDRDVIGCIVSFTAHPTILGASNLLISGDYPGHVERAVEARLSDAAVALFCNGAEGDQSVNGAGKAFEGVAQYGDRLAQEVVALLRTCEMDARPAFNVVSRTLTLPQRSISPAFEKSARDEYPVPPELAGRLLQVLFPDEALVQVVRMGDAMLITVPGEAVAAIGLELKARARLRGVPHPFIAGLANTYCGYILTPEEYDEGGYEAAVSLYGREFGPFLVRQLLPMIETAS